MAEQGISPVSDPQPATESVSAAFLRESGLVTSLQEIASAQNRFGAGGGVDSAAFTSDHRARTFDTAHEYPYEFDLTSRVDLTEKKGLTYITLRYNGEEGPIANSPGSGFARFDVFRVYVTDQGKVIVRKSVQEERYVAESLSSSKEGGHNIEENATFEVELPGLARSMSGDELTQRVLALMVAPKTQDVDVSLAAQAQQKRLTRRPTDLSIVHP